MLLLFANGENSLLKNMQVLTTLQANAMSSSTYKLKSEFRNYFNDDNFIGVCGNQDDGEG